MGGTINTTGANVLNQTLTFASPNTVWNTSFGTIATLTLTGNTTITANATTNPFGANTATKLVENKLLKQNLIDYFDEKIKQYELEYPIQNGGNADYKKKYHKYKDMYNSLLKKYNKLKSD